MQGQRVGTVGQGVLWARRLEARASPRWAAPRCPVGPAALLDRLVERAAPLDCLVEQVAQLVCPVERVEAQVQEKRVS